MKRFLISAAVTIILFSILFTQISLRDLLSLFAEIDPLWATLGCGAYFLATLFRALRFHSLVHSRKVSLDQLFRISVFYHLSLMVLPSKLGELSYPYLLNRIGGLSITEGLASLIAARTYDFLIIIMIFFFSSIGFQKALRNNLPTILLLTVSLVIAVLLVFFNMSALFTSISKLWRAIFKALHQEESRPFLWVQKKLHEISEDLLAIQAKRTYFSVALTSLLSWLMIFLTFQAFLLGFGVEMPLPRVIFGSTLAVIANALPIGGIGNWGTHEAGWAVGFLMTGLTKEKAIATGFGVHILIFVFCGLMALLSWITLKKKALLPR